MATLEPENGVVPMTVANVPGVQISGLIFDAGPVNSPALLEVGTGKGKSHAEASDPTGISDVFFRIGGAHVGKATTSLVVNSDNVILDDIWAWRADHGTGVGWTVNTADTGVDRQRRRRHGIRALRRALPEDGNDLERQRRATSCSSRTRCRTTRRARPPGWLRPAIPGTRPWRSRTE